MFSKSFTLRPMTLFIYITMSQGIEIFHFIYPIFNMNVGNIMSNIVNPT